MPFVTLLLICAVLMKEGFLESLILISLLEMVVYTISLFKIWFHIVMLIILLEFFSIKLFFLSSLELMESNSQMVIFMLLVFMVTEASMGMSLVVGTARSWGDTAMII